VGVPTDLKWSTWKSGSIGRADRARVTASDPKRTFATMLSHKPSGGRVSRLGTIFIGCFFVAASSCALVFHFQSRGAEQPAIFAFYVGAAAVLIGCVVGAAIFIRNVGLIYRKVRRSDGPDR
jgi:hypothetical protein